MHPHIVLDLELYAYAQELVARKHNDITNRI
jgi:hypothetical protein